MKNLAKIFMAVAVAMFAFSCVNDATEDTVVKVGGKTTLTLSLENTRTQLGEAADGVYPITWAADGVYPITWAEGDQITVNGETSEPLAAADADTANAVFTFNAELAAPYCVAYPAAEANQVVFAAEQEYVDGTFANGAATMYGYATDSNITLNHLTGVLKIGVTGTSTLEYIRISTLDRAPIAGKFAIDFATGALTATEESAEVITYSFGSGVELSTEPTYAHIAVPAGVYNELYVTLVDTDGGVMYATVKANDEKPLTAGNIREFATPIAYAAMDESDNAEIFVIKDFETLCAFKEAVEAAETAGNTATLAKNAVVVADIEIPMNPWTPWTSINAPNYKGTFNGNGFAIVYDSVFAEDNLLAQPLFNTTAATIKGVHLKGVYINSDCTSANVGALVCTYNGTSITNCSVEGKFNLYRSTVDADNIGALVGYVEKQDALTLSDCVGNCEMNVVLNNATSNKSIVSGLFAMVENISDNSKLETLAFNNNSNKAAINVSGSVAAASLCVGGVVGEIGNYKHTTENCHNSGDVTVTLTNAKTVRVGGVYADHIHRTIDGVAHRDVSVTFKNYSNSGDVKVSVTDALADDSICIGGVFGRAYDRNEGGLTINNCDNSGSIEYYGPQSATTYDLYVAGIAGYASGRVYLSNCDNTGEKVYSSFDTQGGVVGVGGLVGYLVMAANDNVSNSGNRTTLATCTNSANVSSYIKESKDVVCVGATVAAWYATGSNKFYQQMSNTTNTGNLVVSNGSSTDKSITYAGFIGTTFVSGASDKTNWGGLKDCQLTNCINGVEGGNNTLTVTGNHYTVYAGGMVGYNFMHFVVSGSSNNMAYVSDADVAYSHNYGGLYGYCISKSEFKTAAIKDGTLTTNKMTHNITGYVNNGAISVSTSVAGTLNVAGLIGIINDSSKNMHMKINGVTNNGAINVAGSGNVTYTNLYVAGLIAKMATKAGSGSTYTITNDQVNLGNITVSGLTPGEGAATFIGGAVGSLTKDLSNFKSNCTLTVDADMPAGMLAGDVSTCGFAFTNSAVGGKLVEGTNETVITASNLAQYLFSDRVLTEYAGVSLY